MNTCPKCGSPADPEARFCADCGAYLAVSAPEMPQGHPAQPPVFPAAYGEPQPASSPPPVAAPQIPVFPQTTDVFQEPIASQIPEPPLAVAYSQSSGDSHMPEFPQSTVAPQATVAPQPIGAPQLTSFPPTTSIPPSAITMSAAGSYIPESDHRKSPLKLIIGIAASLVIVAGAVMAFFFLQVKSPSDRVEGAMRKTAENIVDSKTVGSLFGLDLLESMENSPSRTSILLDTEAITMDLTMQSDPTAKRMLLDLSAVLGVTGDDSVSVEGSLYTDNTKLYLNVPQLANALSVDLNMLSKQWNDSYFGQLYQLTEDDKAMLDRLFSGEAADTDLFDAESQRERLTEIYNTFLDSLQYEEMKKQETPAGTSLDCVAVRVPQDALIAFVNDVLKYETDLLEASLSSLTDLGMDSSMPSASDFDELIRELTAMNPDLTLYVYYDRDGARCVSADLSFTLEGEDCRAVLYAETESSKAPLSSWKAGFIGYSNEDEVSIFADGRYTYTTTGGHVHNVVLSMTEYGITSEVATLIMKWNPENATDNFSLLIQSADSGTFTLEGNYYVTEDKITAIISETSFTNSLGEKEILLLNLTVTVEESTSVSAPDYIDNAKDMLSITEDEFAELLSPLLSVGVDEPELNW